MPRMPLLRSEKRMAVLSGIHAMQRPNMGACCDDELFLFAGLLPYCTVSIFICPGFTKKGRGRSFEVMCGSMFWSQFGVSGKGLL